MELINDSRFFEPPDVQEIPFDEDGNETGILILSDSEVNDILADIKHDRARGA